MPAQNSKLTTIFRLRGDPSDVITYLLKTKITKITKIAISRPHNEPAQPTQAPKHKMKSHTRPWGQIRTINRPVVHHPYVYVTRHDTITCLPSRGGRCGCRICPVTSPPSKSSSRTPAWRSRPACLAQSASSGRNPVDAYIHKIGTQALTTQVARQTLRMGLVLDKCMWAVASASYASISISISRQHKGPRGSCLETLLYWKPKRKGKQGRHRMYGRHPRTAPHLVVGNGDELEVALLGPAADDLRERVRQPHLWVFGCGANQETTLNNSIRTSLDKNIDTCMLRSTRSRCTLHSPSPSHTRRYILLYISR